MPLTQPIAVAVVENAGCFLVGQRPSGVPLAGLWEFPGGKVVAAETVEQAAVRECLEETGLRVVAVEVLDRVRYEYAHGIVELTFVACRPCDPVVPPQAGFRWVDRATLATLEFPPANETLIRRLVVAR